MNADERDYLDIGVFHRRILGSPAGWGDENNDLSVGFVFVGEET